MGLALIPMHNLPTRGMGRKRMARMEHRPPQQRDKLPIPSRIMFRIPKGIRIETTIIMISLPKK